MKKALVLVLALLLIFTLVSCTEEAAPDGMQLCYGSEAVGYKFYVPEGFILSNTGEVHAAYASRVDVSSFSFAEVKLNYRYDDPDAYFFSEYFNESLREFPSAPTVTVNGENVIFGKKDYTAEKAVKYVIQHEYDNHKFTSMQILMKANSRYYIFTYTSMDEIRSDTETYYAFHLKEAQKCIEEFQFFIPKGEDVTPPEYEKDSDGYLLYSDESLAGFSLYMPESFTLDFGSAIVSATHEDGSNVTMTKVTAAGVSVDKYWERRKTELSAIVSNLTVISENAECEFGNAQNMFKYEYTFNYNGKTFRVYQVLAVYGYNGYVFTYTAKAGNYDLHLEEIMKITDKVVLK